MKKSTKAALLSALVFPGVGHLFLKKYFPGIALVGASLVAVSYIVSKVVERSLQLVEKIQSGDVLFDAATISEAISNQSADNESQLLTIATLTIIICWVVGILDSYRAGCADEKE